MENNAINTSPRNKNAEMGKYMVVFFQRFFREKKRNWLKITALYLFIGRKGEAVISYKRLHVKKMRAWRTGKRENLFYKTDASEPASYSIESSVRIRRETLSEIYFQTVQPSLSQTKKKIHFHDESTYHRRKMTIMGQFEADGEMTTESDVNISVDNVYTCGFAFT